jgi:hypothetical protein
MRDDSANQMATAVHARRSGDGLSAAGAIVRDLARKWGDCARCGEAVIGYPIVCCCGRSGTHWLCSVCFREFGYCPRWRHWLARLVRWSGR